MPFVQSKKRKKHPWRSVTLSKVADSKNNIPLRFFFHGLNTKTDTKSRNAPHHNKSRNKKKKKLRINSSGGTTSTQHRRENRANQ